MQLQTRVLGAPGILWSLGQKRRRGAHGAVNRLPKDRLRHLVRAVVPGWECCPRRFYVQLNPAPTAAQRRRAEIAAAVEGSFDASGVTYRLSRVLAVIVLFGQNPFAKTLFPKPIDRRSAFGCVHIGYCIPMITDELINLSLFHV